MPEADGSTRARRSGYVPLCAVFLSAACGIWLPACLNPLPDDQPSDRDVPDVPGPDLSGPPFFEGEAQSPGAGMGPATPSIDEEEPRPSVPEPLPTDAQPRPDAGAPEAGVAAENDPEGAIQ